jgi:hypothetical protein
MLFYIAALVFVIALIVLGAWAWRTLAENGVALPGGQMFKPARDKRIGAVETASIDGKRKLVLIRRDDVEHLILTGGPIDVVIETGIAPHVPAQVYQQPMPTYVQQPVAAPYGQQPMGLDPRFQAARIGDDPRAYRGNE